MTWLPVRWRTARTCFLMKQIGREIRIYVLSEISEKGNGGMQEDEENKMLKYLKDI